MPRKKVNIGQMLVESLTSEQIAGLLTVISSASDLNLYMGKFEETDPDMAAAVKRILSHGSGSKGGSKTKLLASLKRTMESWESLWHNYDDIISEVGDEDGRYAVEDHHWEPPYFDGSSLAYDLEPIAEKMLTIMDEVYDEVNDPDLFHNALEEIDVQIGAYPEWMGAEHGEPCVLEEKMTQCVLKWLWLSSKNETEKGKTFAEKVLELENVFEMVELESKGLVEFLVELPESACRGIYEFLKMGDHRADLDNTYSTWHQIKHEYEARFDSDSYLESCQKHLPKNWRYGLPLVNDALNQNNDQLAESLLIKTFSSYLGGDRKKRWLPETSLLLTERTAFFPEGDEDIASLLKTWADVTKRLKNKGRCAAAQFQAVTFYDSEKWDMVLKVYQRLSKGVMQKKLAPLFTQWKNEIAARSYPYSLDSSKVSDTWIHWLIEAILDVKKDGSRFLNKIADWLSDLEKHPKALKQQWLWLGLFTRDLPNSEKIKAKYPSFWKTVLPEDDSGGELASSRRKGLRKMKAGSYLAEVLEFWKKHIRNIIPDPVNAHKSNYTEYACWANALFELNKDEYHALMAQWRRKHHRRRNLWRDLKAMNLPAD